MPATVKDLAAALEAAAPMALAEPWDSVGLQIGDPAAPVTVVLLAVDATLAVVRQASAKGAQLLVTHHPLLFAPLGSILAGDPVSDVAAELIRRGMAFYAAHTNLDVTPQVGTAATLAALLEMRAPQVLRCGGAGAAGPDGELTGAGRVGELPEPLTAQAFAERVCQQLAVGSVRLIGDPSAEIRRFAAIPGAGGEGLADAASAGAQAVVTGELKHHELLEARARGLVVVLAGHLQTERPALAPLQRYLQDAFPELTVTVASEDWPEIVVTG